MALQPPEFTEVRQLGHIVLNGTMKHLESGSFIEPFINYRKPLSWAAPGSIHSAKAL